MCLCTSSATQGSIDTTIIWTRAESFGTEKAVHRLLLDYYLKVLRKRYTWAAATKTAKI